MTKKILLIICYIIAAFFTYSIIIIGFLTEPTVFKKILMMSISSIVASVSMLIGLYLSNFRNWHRDLGIVLISASVFAVILITFHISRKMEAFSDFITGPLCIVSFLIIGGFLLKMGQKKKILADTH